MRVIRNASAQETYDNETDHNAKPGESMETGTSSIPTAMYTDETGASETLNWADEVLREEMEAEEDCVDLVGGESLLSDTDDDIT